MEEEMPNCPHCGSNKSVKVAEFPTKNDSHYCPCHPIILARYFKPKPDKINPSHYRSHPSGVECIQVTEHFGFCVGNAIKYLWRCGQKNGEAALDDLKKARWYVDREISRLEEGK